MERLRVPATKSNLLKLKEQLAFARQGKELLSRKREVLVMEMLRLQDEAERNREELDRQLADAYRAFTAAVLAEGFDQLARLALAVPADFSVKIEERSIMGVIIPVVEGGIPPWRPPWGLAAASPTVDEAARRLRETLGKLLETAEIETAIYRLAAETRKTLRRERALEYRSIPQYAGTVKYIEENLEEKDREGFYQMKLGKKRRGE